MDGTPSRDTARYDPAMSLGAIEIFYTSLLVLSALVIGWFSVYAVYKLFMGQS